MHISYIFCPVAEQLAILLKTSVFGQPMENEFFNGFRLPSEPTGFSLYEPMSFFR